MSFSTIPPLGQYLHDHLHVVDPEQRAVVENFAMEERVSPSRVNAYAKGFGVFDPTQAFGMDQWAGAHWDYQRELMFCDVDDPQIPETFQTANSQNAWPTAIHPNLYLLRLEDARFALSGSTLTLPELESSVRTKAAPQLQAVCDGWNARRDLRPAYATTEIAVTELLDEVKEDWPDALRDALGLGHFNPRDTASEPIPVILMRYQVAEVERETHHHRHDARFAIPTVLEPTGLNPYFYPTPSPAPASEMASSATRLGRAVNLSPAKVERDYNMGMELVHSRLTYKPGHFYRFGYIRQAFQADLQMARQLHLSWLRLESDREDFGALA